MSSNLCPESVEKKRTEIIRKSSDGDIYKKTALEIDYDKVYVCEAMLYIQLPKTKKINLGKMCIDCYHYKFREPKSRYLLSIVKKHEMKNLSDKNLIQIKCTLCKNDMVRHWPISSCQDCYDVCNIIYSKEIHNRNVITVHDDETKIEYSKYCDKNIIVLEDEDDDCGTKPKFSGHVGDAKLFWTLTTTTTTTLAVAVNLKCLE
ncbi:hypothetical protein [Ectropis obliqua nucleopolyhedrovirus]|uniref:Uncharacterized protein n=1 Tax=Ectropis obliqua nucleopolyhedrovirus TaxID=59376 RepID=A0EZ13_9ABAC|nr:hypothetical protein EONV_gp110 [Ectropis obliqua nucleopolyhedrovirus]ABI35793.1 hypothetical protein [Ectropis obliqua nucleopolyhedrovirus]